MKDNYYKSIFYCLLILFFFIYNKKINYLDKLLIQQKKEMEIMEKYFLLCNNGILLNKKKFKKVKNPKISIISPIHDKEKCILRFLRSIQNQFFNEIEIILIDDCSNDNSLKLIKKYRKDDERIILIKNKNNKGTLISRNEGVIISKGKYLFFVDPDDILSNNILSLCYKEIEKNNYDIVRFNIYSGKKSIILKSIVNRLDNNPIFQPELSLYLFYGLKTLEQTDYFIWNKCIKREVFIMALKLINNYFLEQYMIDCEDGLINFMIYKIAKSYYFIKNVGYYYIINNNSITIKSKNNLKRRLKSNFLYFKFIFKYTKNNKKEKKIAEYIFISIYKNYEIYIFDFLKDLNQDLELYKEVVSLFLNCFYISDETKIIFNQINYILKEKSKKIIWKKKF